MKKYVSLIVCAVITLVALIVPIGNGARYDGKGSGKNQSVENLSELSTALKGDSLTYTFSYSEGIDINRHSLSIYIENYQDITQTAYITVYQSEDLDRRVTDLHKGNKNSDGFGRLSNNMDYLYFVSMDMNTGIVKINYQNDNYGNAAIDEDLWTSYGYCSASDLGLDTKEATGEITVYSNSAKTSEATTIQEGQIFILLGENDGVKSIEYSDGVEFKKGYISSNSYQNTYVSVYYNKDQEKDAIDGTDLSDAFLQTYSKNTCQKSFKDGEINHGDTYRYYSSNSVKYNDGPTRKVTNYSVISVLEGGEWKTKYAISKDLNGRVDTTPYDKTYTSGYDRGEIKVFQTKDMVYAQVEAETSLAHSTSATRTTINAEFILTENKNLIKINSFFYADESGVNSNKEAMKFLTGSEDGKQLAQGQIKINQWVDTEDAKIYFNGTPDGEIYNPLNFFIEKYFNADGTLKFNDFMVSVIDSNSLVQDGKHAEVKSSIGKDVVRESLYKLVYGEKFDSFEPVNKPDKIKSDGSIEISFNNKKMPVIKTKSMYVMPEISVFVHSSSLFTTASDRTLVVENVGNTVVPKVVLNEVKSLLG